MTDHITAYIKEINLLYQTGLTTEHSFRPALQRLLQECTKCTVINEQTRIACGAPDLTLLHKNMPIAYIEAKDLEDGDLDGRKKNKVQFNRYKNALETIVFTDYLDFHLYSEGELLMQVQIATIQNSHIVLNADAVARFESLIQHLKDAKLQRITSSVKLAKLMAGKARLMADAVQKGLSNDIEQKGSLWHQLTAFKEVLNNDLDETRFADLYAQTIAYGLFAARIHDTTPETFTRQEAASLIPHSNPFLRQIFQQLAGYDINDSIAWIVDDLVNIFAATDVKSLRKNFTQKNQHRDPMIHFYEDFLHYFDPASKKKFGVYYTPQPVVEFIVRAVDDLLKEDFRIENGLADTSKGEYEIEKEDKELNKIVKRVEILHRTQILDPATGTGTFLAEVVKRIKEKQQKGAWSAYVDEHLIPRIYGFELMMAPYTIAHLKLDMLINWWGDETLAAAHRNRLQIYLTNSLDQTNLEKKHLLAEMIAREANEANIIKHNAPVMVMLGNPPYSVSSSNKSSWILNLLEDYKKNLNEKKLNLDDDYIKFIRLGQYYIERTGEGILAYISNNSFLDGVTHRQMRRELIRCFDDIYILDLHGNNRKKETAPDGSKDENVFDIMQGVSINIFVKKRNSENGQAKLHHYDLFGSRKDKYTFLSDHNLTNVKWQTLQPQEPNLFFVPKDFSLQEEYDKGFKVTNLMPRNNNGLVTDRDSLFYDYERDVLAKRISYLMGGDLDKNFIDKYNIKDSSSYKITKKLKEVKFKVEYITICQYRPFDYKYIYYDPKIISRPADSVLSHINKRNNVALICSRQFGGGKHFISFCTEVLSEKSSQPFAPYYIFPLYLYPDETSIEAERRPNLDETIWRTIENWVQFGQAYEPITDTEKAGMLDFDKQEHQHTLAPEDIFDYIYGVLHSPAYREKYKEFLKVDFPRIPYPKNADKFEHFRSFGNQLRELHLMHNVPESEVTFPESGSMVVEQIAWENEKVRINATQYFENVPREAWDFYIGGYQPAQKCLKDRKGRTLSFDDIEHYRKIIAVLSETNKLMASISSRTSF